MTNWRKSCISWPRQEAELCSIEQYKVFWIKLYLASLTLPLHFSRQFHIGDNTLLKDGTGFPNITRQTSPVLKYLNFMWMGMPEPEMACGYMRGKLLPGSIAGFNQFLFGVHSNWSIYSLISLLNKQGSGKNWKTFNL